MTMAQDGGKVVSLTHRPLLPPGNTPGTHFCKRLNRPQGHSAIGRITSMKNSNDTIGNRTSDLVAQHLNHCEIDTYTIYNFGTVWYACEEKKIRTNYVGNIFRKIINSVNAGY